MSKTKLHQIIAIAKGVKSRVYAEVTALHKDSQKSEPYNGLNRTFRKKDEDGEDFPPERKKASLNAETVLANVSRLQNELFDTQASIDWTNTRAKADVVVDGKILVADAPVTFLLFLEKQVTDMRTFVDKMPTLDEAETWSLDPASGLYRSEMTTTHKTKKVQKPIVLYDAVVKDGQALPAQTQLITEDVIVGWWDAVKSSGALPVPRKAALLERIDKLLKAVKMAREKANDIEADSKEVGAAIHGYLFSA